MKPAIIFVVLYVMLLSVVLLCIVLLFALLLSFVPLCCITLVVLLSAVLFYIVFIIKYSFMDGLSLFVELPSYSQQLLNTHAHSLSLLILSISLGACIHQAWGDIEASVTSVLKFSSCFGLIMDVDISVLRVS